MSYKIRILRGKDIQNAVVFLKEVWPEIPENAILKDLVEQFTGGTMGPWFYTIKKFNRHKKESEIVGLIGFEESMMGFGYYNLFWVSVKPNLQRKGFGEKLVSQIVELIKKKPHAKIICLTTVSPSYYKKFNFQKKFEVRGETFMTLELS